MSFDRLSVLAVDRDRQTYTVGHASGTEVEGMRTGDSGPLSATFERSVVESRRPMFANPRGPRELVSRFPGGVATAAAGLRSLLAAPLVADGRLIGVLSLASLDPGTYGAEDRTLLSRVASAASAGLANWQLAGELARARAKADETETRLADLFDETPVGYYELDTEGRITRVNRTQLRMLGYSVDELMGRRIWDFMEEEWMVRESDERRSPKPAAGEDRRDEYVYERTFRCKDGSALFAIVESRPLFDGEGRPTGFRGTVRDITERKLIELSLKENSRLASIGELAAGVAHELNNPLMTIGGYSELLLSREIQPSVRRLVEKINDDAVRAGKVVRGLLSFARSRDPEKRYVEIGPVLRQAIEFKEYDFRVHGIAVSLESNGELPRTLIDENQITQVLLNIMTNAEQAMTRRVAAPRVDVELSADEAAGKISISVTDNGPGIEPELLNRIFDPFFTTKEVGKGTGLGLSICYGIVKRHDGDIWAESVPGTGTTFHVEIPIRSPADEPEMESIRRWAQDGTA